MRRYWFLLALGPVLLASWLLPALPAGDWQGVVKLGLVAAIFLLTGLSIRGTELWRGLGHWRLHVLVQGTSLLLIPLSCWALDPLWQGLGLDPALRLGLVVLGALPTTVTSCVALTAAAGGNRVGAVVNAGLGNLLGVVVTPAWVLLLAGQVADGLDAGPVIGRLVAVVGLPLVVGQLLRLLLGRRLPGWVDAHAGTGSQLLLLAILYLGFQAAVAAGAGLGLAAVLQTIAIAVVLHGLWLGLPWLIGRWAGWRLDAADRRAALLCASQKTLALGLPLIALCFPAHPALPLIALPILVYHPLQLVVAGALVPRLADRHVA